MRNKLEIYLGDITQLSMDAIVNAANTTLLGGGGVDGAIHRAAGAGLLEECRRLGGCETGDAKRTGGHLLKARYVIHAVGPVWNGGGRGEEGLLARCYRRCLELAEEVSLASLAFPCISTGVYRFPKQRAAEIAVGSVLEYLQTGSKIEKIVFCCFSPEDVRIYQSLI